MRLLTEIAVAWLALDAVFVVLWVWAHGGRKP
jgi:hypothetical protein